MKSEVTRPIILLIDNQGDFVGLFQRVLEREKLTDEFICEPVVPSSADLLNDCLTKIYEVLAKSDDIAVVLVDIVLDESIRPSDKQIKSIDRSGFAVAAELRKRLPNTPILGITQWGKVQMLLTDVTLDENFDGLLLKGILTSDGFSKNKFHEYLLKAKRKRLNQSTVSNDLPPPSNPTDSRVTTSLTKRSQLQISRDAITAFQVENLGELVLDSMLTDGFGEAEGSVKYFEPGFSGAMLFEVSGRVRQKTKSQVNPTSWILKASTNEAKLQQELSKHKELKAKNIPADLYSMLLMDELIHHGAWYALITKKDPESITLRSFIQSTPDVSRTSTVMKEIERFLGKLYGTSYLESQLIWQRFYSINRGQIAAIRVVLDRSRKALLDQGYLSEQLIKRVETFVVSGGESERAIHEYRDDNVDTRLIHGDFHTRNVLINPREERIITIDFPEMKQDHAAKDFAKLEIDVIFSVLNSINGADTNWRTMSEWSFLLQTLQVDDNFFNPNISALSAKVEGNVVAHIRRCAKSIVPSLTSREYLLSLLYHCIRSLAYPDIPLPKKAFALTYSNCILEQFS